MTWALLAGLVLAVVCVVRVRRRGKLFTVLRSEPISTMHMEISGRHTKKTRAALKAATAELW
jgi:hypothetical protein